MAKKRGKTKVKPEHYFVLADGRQVKSLIELVDALDDIEDDVFSHHVNSHKNDFSTWIRQVFRENELADSIQNLQSKQAVQIKILKFLVRMRK